MKVLPKKEFGELIRRQGFEHPETIGGLIDKETLEATVPSGSKTRIKTHEVGHGEFEHYSKAVKFYGKREPWGHMVDDEIEAEIYSYESMGKELTPRVGMQALRRLVGDGWKSSSALSLVIGRLRHYGIEVSWKERMDLVRLVEKYIGEELEDYRGMDV